MMIAAHNSAEFPKRSRKPHHRIEDQPACAGLRKNTALEVERGEEEHGAQRVVRPNPQALADVWEQQPAEEQPGEEQPGEKQPGEKQPGEEQPGEEQPGQEH